MPDKRDENASPPQAAPYSVQRAKKVDKYLGRHTDLRRQWPQVQSALSDNPYARQGSDVIVHLRGDLLCNYRWRQGDYRFLYEVHNDARVVWVFDVDSRGQVYR